VTAQDAAFSYRLAQEEEFPGYGRGLSLIENIETNGDHELVFELAEEFGPFTSRTLTYGPILPEHIWGEVEQPREFQNEEFIGSGPWILEDWRREERLIYTANEDHWAAPNADKLIYAVLGGNAAMINAINNKEIDLVGRSIGLQALDQVEGEDHLEVEVVDSFGAFTLHPIVTKKPFDDPEVRRALHHSLNRKLANELQNNLATQGKGTVLHPEQFGSLHGEMNYPEYNLEKARQILADAGYWWDDNGQLMYPE
jgi:peptide/nickel transport system substrate-binding protein